MHSQEWDGSLHIIDKNYCVVNNEIIWPKHAVSNICLYQDAAPEVRHAVGVTFDTYATCVQSVATFSFIVFSA